MSIAAYYIGLNIIEMERARIKTNSRRLREISGKFAPNLSASNLPAQALTDYKPVTCEAGTFCLSNSKAEEPILTGRIGGEV